MINPDRLASALGTRKSVNLQSIPDVLTWAFLAGVASGGRNVSTPSLTPLYLKLDYSNFVKNCFGVR